MTRRKQSQPRSCKQSSFELLSNCDGIMDNSFISDTEASDDSTSRHHLTHRTETYSTVFEEADHGVGRAVAVTQLELSHAVCQLSARTMPSYYCDSEDDMSSSVSSLDTRSTTSLSDMSVRTSSPSVECPGSSLVTCQVTDSTPYKCSFCDRCYSRQSLVKLHEQTHPDRLPFQCTYCQHRFKHKRSRDRHVKLHTGEKKFKCQQCSSAYCRSDHLKSHLRTHDKRKPHQCSVCNRGYRTVAALTSHQQRHKHNNSPAAKPAVSAAERATLSVPNSGTLAPPSDDLSNGQTEQSPPPSVGSVECASEHTLVKQEGRLEELENATAATEHRAAAEAEIEPNEMEMQQMLDTPSQKMAATVGEAIDVRRSSSTPTTAASVKAERWLGSVREAGAPVASARPPTALGHQLWACPYCDPTSHCFSSVEALSYHIQTLHSSTLMSVTLANNTVCSSVPHHLLTSTTTSASTTDLRRPDLSQPGHAADTAAAAAPPVICPLCRATQPDIRALVHHMRALHSGDSSATVRPLDKLVKNGDNSRSLPPVVKRARYEPADSGQDAAAAPGPVCVRDSQTAPLICTVCAAVFANFESYRVHFQLYHLDGEWSSSAAASDVSSSGGVSGGVSQPRHRHSESDAVVCDHCGAIFQAPALLYTHLVTVLRSVGVRHKCRACDSRDAAAATTTTTTVSGVSGGRRCHSLSQHVYQSPALLSEHMQQQHVQIVYRCAICAAVFDTSAEMQSHLAAEHSEAASVVQCAACCATHGDDTGFANDTSFAQHILSVHMSGRSSSSSSVSRTHTAAAAARQLLPADTSAVQVDSAVAASASVAPSIAELAQSLLLTASPAVPCPYCPMSFAVPYQLELHISDHHRHHQTIADSLISRHATRHSMAPPPRSYCLAASAFASHNQQPPAAVSSTCSIGTFTSTTSSGSCAPLNPVYPAVRHKCNICDQLLPSSRELAHHKLCHCKVTQATCCAVCKCDITTAAIYRHHVELHNSAATAAAVATVVYPATCVVCLQTLVTEHELSLHAHFHLAHLSQTAAAAAAVTATAAAVPPAPPPAAAATAAPPSARVSGAAAITVPINLGVHSAPTPATPSVPPTAAAVSPTSAATTAITSSTTSSSSSSTSSSNNSPANSGSNKNSPTSSSTSSSTCQLCSAQLASSQQLHVHLVEHSFAGCGGYTCYLCQAVYTTAGALSRHLSTLHGWSARPFDCTQCGDKFFFRVELDHHTLLCHRHRHRHRHRQHSYYERQTVGATLDHQGAAHGVSCQSQVARLSPSPPPPPHDSADSEACPAEACETECGGGGGGGGGLVVVAVTSHHTPSDTYRCQTAAETGPPAAAETGPPAAAEHTENGEFVDVVGA